jgi:hypothetical protein
MPPEFQRATNASLQGIQRDRLRNHAPIEAIHLAPSKIEIALRLGGPSRPVEVDAT